MGPQLMMLIWYKPYIHIIIIIIWMAGTCEYGDELSGSISAGNFLTSGRTSWLLKKDSAAWSK